jgi:hypothetical protein
MAGRFVESDELRILPENTKYLPVSHGNRLKTVLRFDEYDHLLGAQGKGLFDGPRHLDGAALYR